VRPENPDRPDVAQSVRDEQARQKETDRERRARLIKVLVGLGIAIVLLIFITSNSQGVKVHFVFFTRRPPLIWVMFACAVLGGALGYLIGKPGQQLTLRRRSKGDDKKK